MQTAEDIMRKPVVLIVAALGLLGLLAAPAVASAKTITVAPSPTGNDTADLQQAFATAGPGGTVQLTAGHFVIDDILVTGFQGTFRGAGRGSTVIGCPKGGVSLKNGLFTYLLCFQGGALTVSDMSFDITSSAPAAKWGPTDYFSGSHLTFIEAVLYLNGQSSVAIERVGFAGYANDHTGPGGYNADQSVFAEDTQACAMHGCTCATADGFWGQFCSDARVTIGGPRQGNVFYDPGIGCGFYDFNESQVAVCDNRFRCGGSQDFFGGCVFVNQEPGVSASQYRVSGNVMRELPPWDAMGFWDGASPGTSPEVMATVTDNHFDLGTADDPLHNGVGELDTQNIRYRDNVLSGYVDYGIPVGNDPLDSGGYFPVSGWQIVGNDFRQLHASVADVALLYGTSDCLVVGGPPPTTVLDQGTGNLLVNCTLVPAPTSQAAAPMGSLKQMKSLKEMKGF
jgi:hypothetical protein